MTKLLSPETKAENTMSPLPLLHRFLVSLAGGKMFSQEDFFQKVGWQIEDVRRQLGDVSKTDPVIYGTNWDAEMMDSRPVRVALQEYLENGGEFHLAVAPSQEEMVSNYSEAIRLATAESLEGSQQGGFGAGHRMIFFDKSTSSPHPADLANSVHYREIAWVGEPTSTASLITQGELARRIPKERYESVILNS